MNATTLATNCYAKLNWMLEVVARRSDGYHDLASVFQTIALADVLTVEPAADLSLVCDDPVVPVDESNLILRAAVLLCDEYGVGQGAHFTLQKCIPMGAGLGGGSSDCAGALRLLSTLWKLDLRHEERIELATHLGADVPFFLTGGTCLCEGIGERVTPLPASSGDLCVQLLLPPWRIQTVGAYRALGPVEWETVSPAPMIDALSAGDPAAVGSAAFNRFTRAVCELECRQGELLDTLAAVEGAWVCMSGSGSAVWCVVENDAARDELSHIAAEQGCVFVPDVPCISREMACSIEES